MHDELARENERLRAAQQPSSPETDDQYRKKPVVIRAWRLGSEEARPEWAKWTFGNGHDYAEVQTLEGTMRGNRGDWIIQGVKGELYFCKPDIFAATYEPASSPAQCAPTDPLTDLVERFSKALLAKLRLAEANGRSGWDRDDWEKQCQEGLLRHVDKGDPRDVAAYCAFMWHHGWITALTSTQAPAQCALMQAALQAFITAYGSQDSFTDGLDKARALAVSALALSQKAK